MKDLRVKCPNCKGIFHKTTDNYDATVLPNGSMIQLIDKYTKLHWSAFADGLKACKGTSYSNMRCPSCTASMLVKNRLVVIPENVQENSPKFKHEVRGKIRGSKGRLGARMRVHQKNRNKT